jgi:hypothetical protein
VILKPDFHLNVCFKCSKALRPHDEVYSISEGVFNNNAVVTVYESIILFSDEFVVPKEIYFHKICYLEIAGEEYEFE